ncbi:MAG: HAMP domain-containing histidine kinase [Chloroflexi bacterium]|nr:HAMP domain-containing histidine kinase [Chloroflexota bacterium]
MRLPFSTVRANLIVAFAAVIAISLLLASGAFAYLLREYQLGAEEDRQEQRAQFYGGLVLRMALQGNSLQSIDSQLDMAARDGNARVLLLDGNGTVLHDTQNDEYAGRTFAPPRTGGRRPNVLQGQIETPSGNDLLTVVAARGLQPTLLIGIIQPEQTLTNAWQEVLPRLSLAALSALLVSIAIAWWLASTITRPIVQITHASEEMASGNLDPDLALPETNDEVGRLSQAFTTMAHEVARSHIAMRDLLANVSHDLRTPLTSISGFAGALVDGTMSGPEEAREAGRIIGEEAERMRRLLEDLLYLSRIEAGDVSLQRVPVDLADLARAVQSRFSLRAQESGVRLTVFAGSAVVVAGDSRRLGQVLDNLVENAFKHTPPSGSIDVTVSLDPDRTSGRAPSRPARTGVLTVHNTGSYIPPDEAGRVFERFYQLDKARASREGRGLGLAIASEIVQAHGGRIDLESSITAGTSFSVRIPALEPAPSTGLTSPEPARPAEVGAARR